MQQSTIDACSGPGEVSRGRVLAVSKPSISVWHVHGLAYGEREDRGREQGIRGEGSADDVIPADQRYEHSGELVPEPVSLGVTALEDGDVRRGKDAHGEARRAWRRSTCPRPRCLEQSRGFD